MAAKTETGPTAFRKGDRVVLTKGLPGVPEGTQGKVKTANGLTWLRYWVDFDNGPWVGSVSATDLVAAGDWESFKQRRAEEAARPKEAPKAAAATEGDGAATGGGAVGGVPAHLLERSKAARARKAASG